MEACIVTPWGVGLKLFSVIFRVRGIHIAISICINVEFWKIFRRPIAKRTQQISIVTTCDFCFFQLPHTADFYRCYKQFLKRSSVRHSSGAAWELYFRPILCSSIGVASHVVHNFCRETPHTADFCLQPLAIRNKYQTCLISQLSLLRLKSLVLSYRTQQIC